MWRKKLLGLILLMITSICIFACGNNEISRESKNIAEEVNNIKAVMEYEEEVSLNELGTVKYGKYPQSDENGKKKEDIEWIIIKKEDGKAYLLSKYILEHRQFEASGTDFEFKDSSLCKWLNEDFYNDAFENDNLIVDYEGQKVSLAPTQKGFGSIYFKNINTVNTKYAGRYYKNIGNYEEQFNKISTISKSNGNGISSNDTDRLYEVVEKYKNLFPTDKTFFRPMEDNRQFVEDLEAFNYFVLGYQNKGYIKYINENGVSGGSGHLLKQFYGIRPMIVIRLDEENREATKETKSKKIDNKNYGFGEIVRHIFTVDRFDDNANVDSLRSIKFGKFDGKDIEWLILERDNNKALLLSKYNLDSMKFSNEYDNNDWEKSEIRKYLNNEFYNKSFTDEEKKIIKESMNINDGYKVPINYFEDKNEMIVPYNRTNDNIFLLSWDEIIKHFKITDFNKGINKVLTKNLKADEEWDESSTNSYWTRTPLIRMTEGNDENNVLYVASNYFKGNEKLWKMSNFVKGIRPALYVEYNNVYRVDVDGDYNFYIDNIKQANTWIDYLDDKYYLDENGYPVRNKFIDGVFVGNNGKMAKNTTLEDGSYIDFDGKVVNLENDLSDSIKEEQNEANAWYRTKSGIWYYFEKDRNTKKKGWFDESRDNQRYYLDEITGVMATGWKNINGSMYYFSETTAKEPNWYYVEHSDSWESFGKDIKSLGSMYRNEITPDGIMVDQEGRAYGDALSNIMIDTNNIQPSSFTQDENKNNDKLEEIYSEIKENFEYTIFDEKFGTPSLLEQADAKLDKDGNLWITYINYSSGLRDLMIMHKDGTRSEYKTYSVDGDVILYEVSEKNDYINDSDEAKLIYTNMYNKYMAIND